MQFLVDHLDLLMFAAAVALLLRGFPVAFTLAGVGLLFALIGAQFQQGFFVGGDVLSSLSFLKPFFNRIFGLMDETNEVLVAVPLFVFMGVMLERSQVAGDLLETMGKLFGTLRGGLGLSVTFVGMLLAASTGIVGATVVTMGMISLPSMLKYNYDKGLACGSIAAAGTLGQIIPPSIVLVILGDVISNEYIEARRLVGDWAPKPVSVGDLFVGALLPGLLLVALYMFYQIGLAFLRPSASPAMPPSERATAHELLRVLAPPILLIFAVLGSILFGVATPTEAASVGCVGAILLAGERADEARPWPQYLAVLGLFGALLLKLNFDLRLTRAEIEPIDFAAMWVAGGFLGLTVWGLALSLLRIHRAGTLRDVMQSTTKVTAMVFMILIGAQLFNLTFRGLGGEETMHEILSAVPGGAFGAMLAVMLLMFVLGFFLDFLEIVFVVIPITAPTLFMLGLDPIWVAIMIAVNLQTSFLTPPFGFALFYLRGVAPPEVSTMDIYRGVIPFVIIQLIALGILALYPPLATWLPGVVFG
ncbi:MAG: TRAP transporter large permease subunit [Rubrimonas sp.]|uniref:TRAP transporter large permease n=1 Tax=Rubrimonas sp. TaxID=2036015 RepID=UPI002FDE1C11